MKRRLVWLVRGPTWRAFHLHNCQVCWRRFGDNEEGSISAFDERFPTLCRCKDPHIRGHVNCRASGPYCPRCAARITEEQRQIAEFYKDW